MKIVRLTSTLIFALCLTAVSTELRSQETQKSDALIEAAHRASVCVTYTPSCQGHRHGVQCNHLVKDQGIQCDKQCDKQCSKEGTCERKHRFCHDGPCLGGLCENGTCQKCNGSCIKDCPIHGKDCQHDCLKNNYGYGVEQVCPGKINGICPIHGYGVCPYPRQGFGQVCPGKINGICPIHGYGVCPHPRLGVGQFFRQLPIPADRPYFGTQPLYVPREQYDPGYQPLFPRVRALLLTPPAPAYSTVAPPVPLPTYTSRGPRDFLAPNPPTIGY